MTAGFKEWAVVCDALGAGSQSVIIRKGGIAEGRAGFAFRHAEFLLFPTWFHEQIAKTTLPEGTPLPEAPGDELEIRYTVAVEWSGFLADWERVRGLRDFHVLREAVIEERFRQDDAHGVHVAFVRVYRLDPPVRLKNEKKYGGCRSWVELPDWEGSALVSVISDEEHARRRTALGALLGW